MYYISLRLMTNLLKKVPEISRFMFEFISLRLNQLWSEKLLKRGEKALSEISERLIFLESYIRFAPSTRFVLPGGARPVYASTLTRVKSMLGERDAICQRWYGRNNSSTEWRWNARKGKRACVLLSFATLTDVSALFACITPVHWFPNRKHAAREAGLSKKIPTKY